MTKKITSIVLLFGLFSMQAQVGIGTTNPNSTLSVEGSIYTTLTLPLSPITLDETHHTVYASGTTITLPSSAPTGREYVIKAGVAAVTVDGNGSNLDNLGTTYVLNPFNSIRVKALDSSNWIIAGGKFNDQLGAEEINDLTDGKTTTTSVYLGDAAGTSASGGFNTVVGINGGLQLTTGSDNTFIGYQAGSVGGTATTTGAGNILIGKNVRASSATANAELNIGNLVYATGLNTATGKVGVGNGLIAPNSTLAVNGSVSMPIRTTTVATTLTNTDYTLLINSTTDRTITLPDATLMAGRIYNIRAVNNGNAVHTIQTTASQTINGASTTFTITNTVGTSTRGITVQSNGNNWFIIAAARF